MTATWWISVPALDWQGKPMISSNLRTHPMRRHQIQKRIRRGVADAAIVQRIPPAEHITVWLEYHVLDRRRRDPDNLHEIAKPAFDALQPERPPNRQGKGAQAGAGIVRDDAPEYMTKQQCRIVHRPDLRRPHMWLVVTTDPM